MNLTNLESNYLHNTSLQYYLSCQIFVPLVSRYMYLKYMWSNLGVISSRYIIQVDSHISGIHSKSCSPLSPPSHLAHHSPISFNFYCTKYLFYYVPQVIFIIFFTLNQYMHILNTCVLSFYLTMVNYNCIFYLIQILLHSYIKVIKVNYM